MSAKDFRAGKHPFLGITLAAILGILLADFLRLELQVGLGLAAGGLLIWAAIRKTTALLLCVACVFFVIHNLQFDHNPARMLSAELGDGTMTVKGTGIVDSAGAEMETGGRVRSSFELAAANLITSEGREIGPVSLLMRWPGISPKLGDKVSFEGNLYILSPPRNPGEFDYAGWLARRQIFSAVSVPVIANTKLLKKGSDWNPRRVALRSREKIHEIITRDLTDSPVIAGVISAMVLGTTEDTAEATRELFLRTGTLHLFSVSGLHVTMLAAITLFVLLLVRVPRRVALLLTIPAVFAYAMITGASASSMRAALMTSAFVIATLMDRSSLSINTLAVAGFVILVANTNQLFSTGFQLSFTVVTALILLCGPITRWLRTFAQPDPFVPRKLLTPVQKSRWLLAGKLSGSVGLTISAWLGSLPLTAVYFNLFSPVALFANLVIVPMAFVILSLSVLGMLSAASGWLLIAFNNANWGMTKFLVLCLGLFASLPGGSMFVGPHWWQRSGESVVTVFDLGSGGATVWESAGRCWMVDCGSESDYRNVVRRYLQKRGINRVDGIFLTHGDGTHIGGIGQFALDFPKAKIYAPESAKNSLVFRRMLEKNLAINWVSEGDKIQLAKNQSAEVLWPGKKVDSARADDNGLVLRLTTGRDRFLLLSDSGFLTESGLMAQESTDLRADWIFMGRNRNDPGDYESLFRKSGASRVLSTATKFPASEQIPKNLIEVCAKLKMKLLRMDETGAVVITVKPKATTTKVFLDANNSSSKL